MPETTTGEKAEAVPFDFNAFQCGRGWGAVAAGQTSRYRCLPRILCADGFSLSVQAGDGMYCEPRESHLEAYETVEVGLPSDREEALMPYVDDSEVDPTTTVYARVPVDVVNQVVNDHGGLSRLALKGWLLHESRMVREQGIRLFAELFGPTAAAA